MKTIRKLITWVGSIAAIAVIVAVGWYFWVRPAGSVAAAWNSLVFPLATATPGTLSASGTVETTTLSIAPEESGKILEVDFQEGDVVKAGAVLVQLDDSTLKIQRSIAASNLEKAQLTLQQLDSPMIVANLQKTIALDKQAIEDAQQALDTYEYFVNDTAAVQNAQAAMLLAEKAMNRTRNAYDKINGDPNTDTTKAAAYQEYYLAEQAYENASNVYALWTGVPNPEQADLRNSKLAMANAKLAEDQAFLDVLNGGPIPNNATGAGLLQLQQARINVQLAQGNLNLLDDQIAKMTITAPVDGVVMTRSAEPGNVVNPGIELLSLARLNDLTITVYVQEESLGKIKLGQAATVMVDSYPGETFNAAVVDIANQPEFIPHTAQTVPGSSSTVYAIQLELSDGAGRLKPGMPADVVFIFR